MTTKPFTTQVLECVEQAGASGLSSTELRKLLPHIEQASSVVSKLGRRGDVFRRKGMGDYRYFATQEFADARVPADDGVTDRAGWLVAKERAQFGKRPKAAPRIGDGPIEYHPRFKRTVAPTPEGDVRYQVQPGEPVPQTFVPGVPATLADCYSRSRA
jgi:hypothetical protein